jgi:1,2-diacylglycerol-3-alpha-glucose alpha-1,2-glucosyltransferase
MKVRLYDGSFRLVEKSGVGQALQHQAAMLQSVGVVATTENGSDVSLVHFNTVFPDSLFAALLARLRGQMVIYYGHSTMEDFRNSFKLSNVLAPLFKQWIKLCYSVGDVVITPTEYSRSLLLRYGVKKPVYALSNGVDTDFFHPDEERRERFRRKYGLRPWDKAMISVGHFIVRKGILDFIALARSMPEVRFFWFGYTNPRLIPRAVGDAIVDAPPNLCFPGYVNQADLRDAYCGCDLFCFMSHEETEGIVVLEALSCEIPVLVRNIPVYDSWLRDGETVYKGTDLASFQRLSTAIFSGHAANLTAAGRRTAEERSIQEMGQRLLQIYTQTQGKKALHKGFSHPK